MRLLTFVAGVVFFAASGSAFAADCTKGMLWPYTRNPGDCLTDAEIKAGKTGVYSGPLNTNVDVSSIKPETPTQTSTPSSGGGSTGGFFSGGLFGGGSSTPSAPSTPSTSSAPSATAVSCNKSALWPFVREPGDCLTATEKLTNKNGVYRSAEVPQVTQVSANNVPAGDGGAATPPPTSVPTPPASSAPSCEKGWFWPFVRKSGDCPTEPQKK